MRSKVLVQLVAAAVVFFANVECANILGLFPLKLKSHYIVFDSILTELARRGHNVTSVNPFPKKKPLANFTDINSESCLVMPDLFGLDIAHTFRNPFRQILLLTSSVNLYTQIMECEVMRDFLNTTTVKYDLLITESFCGDVMMGFTRKIDAPLVVFVAGPIYPWTADIFGNPDNPSYVSYPHTDMPLSRVNPTFCERLHNTVYYVYARVLYYYYMYTEGDSLTKKYFGADTPSLRDFYKNVSMVLQFSHFSVNLVQPLFPSIVDVAGLQIRDKVSPLPKVCMYFSWICNFGFYLGGT